MRVRQRTVYYCDFCKKKLMRKDSMEKHERHCTMNIDRACRMCDDNDNLRGALKEVEDRYKKELHQIKTEQSIGMDVLDGIIEDIKCEANDCPACTLTIVRHLDLMTFIGCRGLIFYDYSEHCKEWFERKHKEEQRRNEYDAMYA